jgi:hypothetical protein
MRKREVYCEKASMEDKLSLHKYLFKKMFSNDTPEELIKYVWDSKKQFFFSKYRILKRNKHSIINPLLIEMKIELPIINLKNIFFSDSIRSKIKSLIISKYDYSMSSDNKLLALLLNTYLNMDVLKYKKSKKSKKSNDGKWVISTTYDELSKFADKYLKMPKEPILLDIETENDFEIDANYIDYGLDIPCYNPNI